MLLGWSSVPVVPLLAGPGPWLSCLSGMGWPHLSTVARDSLPTVAGPWPAVWDEISYLSRAKAMVESLVGG